MTIQVRRESDGKMFTLCKGCGREVVLNAKPFVIKDGDKRGWWAADSAGYVKTIEEAGRYDHADIERISQRIKRGDATLEMSPEWGDRHEPCDGIIRMPGGI